ncbi:MAG: hypothetical protein EA377_02610, partial [Phycisphaerales bacterium]
AQDAHRAARSATGSVADTKRSTPNAHGEVHGSHSTDQGFRGTDQVFTQREERSNHHTQRPKRAEEMYSVGIGGVQTRIQ